MGRSPNCPRSRRGVARTPSARTTSVRWLCLVHPFVIRAGRVQSAVSWNGTSSQISGILAPPAARTELHVDKLSAPLRHSHTDTAKQADNTSVAIAIHRMGSNSVCRRREKCVTGMTRSNVPTENLLKLVGSQVRVKNSVTVDVHLTR